MSGSAASLTGVWSGIAAMPNWAAGWSPVSAVSWYDTGPGTALDAGGAVMAATPNAPPAPITAARTNRMMMPRGRAIGSYGLNMSSVALNERRVAPPYGSTVVTV